jgi:hypothetical protein
MVSVAQLAERCLVVAQVTGSIPVIYPPALRELKRARVLERDKFDQGLSGVTNGTE